MNSETRARLQGYTHGIIAMCFGHKVPPFIVGVDSQDNFHKRLWDYMEKFFGDEELVDPNHHIIIDRRLQAQMPHGETMPVVMVWPDGSGMVRNDNRVLGEGALCEFSGIEEHDNPTPAMQAYLESQRHKWRWPIPTDADRGKNVYVRDAHNAVWIGPRVLAGVINHNIPFVVTRPDDYPTAWNYAVLVNPIHPDVPPPFDLNVKGGTHK